MWDYLFDPNPNNPPPNKESPCKLNYLQHRKIKCSIKIQLFTAFLYTTWEAARPLQRSTTAKFLKSPTLASHGPC